MGRRRREGESAGDSEPEGLGDAVVIRNLYAFLRMILGEPSRFNGLNAAMGGLGVGTSALSGAVGNLAPFFGGEAPEAWFKGVFPGL